MSNPFTIVKTEKLSGFDSEGEPEIIFLANGNLRVAFQFMPPHFVQDNRDARNLGRYANFDKDMSRAIGIPVIWEDRELFYIENPQPDTTERIRKFVAGYHSE